jgi:hypothetical protein
MTQGFSAQYNTPAIRRGEGGGVGKGGPLWSPVGGDTVRSSMSQHLRRTTAGDHKGPLHPSTPHSPLQGERSFLPIFMA